MLLIYLLDPLGAKLSSDFPPIVGFAISFPGSESTKNIQYAVHQQLLPLFDIDDEFEDYDPDED